MNIEAAVALLERELGATVIEAIAGNAEGRPKAAPAALPGGGTTKGVRYDQR